MCEKFSLVRNEIFEVMLHLREREIVREFFSSLGTALRLELFDTRVNFLALLMKLSFELFQGSIDNHGIRDTFPLE